MRIPPMPLKDCLHHTNAIVEPLLDLLYLEEHSPSAATRWLSRKALDEALGTGVAGLLDDFAGDVHEQLRREEAERLEDLRYDQLLAPLGNAELDETIEGLDEMIESLDDELLTEGATSKSTTPAYDDQLWWWDSYQRALMSDDPRCGAPPLTRESLIL